jgi:integrase
MNHQNPRPSDHIEYALAQWTVAVPIGREKGTLKQRTIHHNFATLKTMLAYAEKRNLIAKNPCASADAPSKGDVEIDVLDEAGVDAVLDGLRDSVLAAPATFAVHTGMRRGEILGLKWEDVDLDRGEASVRRSLEQHKGGDTAFKAPKTTKSRRQVPLTDEAIRVLKAHRAGQNAIKLRLPGWNPEGLIFCDPLTGLRWGPDRFSSSFRYYVHKLGIPVTFHGFGRHGFATIALRAGVSVREVMEILGHTSRAMTDRYTSVLSDQQHDAVDRVGQRLAAARKRVAQ